MNLIIYSLLIFVTLISCGKVEKKPSPFASTSNEQQGGGGDDPAKKEAKFKSNCGKLPGGTLLPGEKVCMYTTSKFERNAEQIKQDFKDDKATVVYADLGKAQIGNYVMVEVKPRNHTGRIEVYANGTVVGVVTDGVMPLTEVPPGDIRVLAYRGSYSQIESYKVKCFTKDQEWVHCR